MTVIDPDHIQDNIQEIHQDQQSLLTSLMPLFYTLGLSSVIVSGFYFILRHFWEQIKKQFFSFITIDNDDPMFKFIQNYLSEVGLVKSGMTSLTATLERASNEPWWKQQDNGTDDYKPNIKYTPASGNHKFTYKGKTIFVSHSVGNTITVGWERTPQKQETLKLWCFGKNNISVLKDIVSQAYKNAQTKDQGKTNIFALHEWWCGWDKVQSKEPRGFDSVILDQNLADTITEDLTSFLKNQEWYYSRGVPYRRGYLLYGPPGTGKTSFILAIAGKLGLNICTVNLSGNRLNDDSLNRLLESTPKRSIVLLEDIDAIFVDRESVSGGKTGGGKGQKVSFSGLLNALDGVRSQEGRILFMTTNHREKLDPALMRPGRADVHVKLNYASENQVKKLFLKFFPEEQELADKFSKSIPEFKVSMAKLQGQFLKYKENPKLALENIGELLEVQSDFSQEMSITDWLLRVGLEKQAWMFIEQDIKRIKDLAKIVEGDLETKFSIKTIGLKKRVMGVINGEQEMIRQFKLMSSNSLRGFFKAILSDSDYTEEFKEQLLKAVPENCVTEFQLRDIIDNKKNKKEGVMIQQIMNLVKRNKLYQKQPELKLQFEKEEKKEEKILKFEVDSLNIIEQCGLKKYSAKFIEQNLTDTDIFLQVDERMLENILKVENVGLRKKFMIKIEQLKKQKEKLQEKLDKGELEDSQCISQTELDNLPVLSKQSASLAVEYK